MVARILIIEDNADSLALAKYLLEAHHYSTLCASDGGEGLRLAREAHPDLVLCDLRVPVLDGYRVVAGIRHDLTLSNIPVIAVTASSMPGERARALISGFNGYVSKPIDPESFVAAVEAFLPPHLRAALQSENR